ncbi:MAG: glycosyltransferase family protein [Candidatus Pacebacteria bacterium]|nr:glycosyltransferase family protein [Candidatus Paceibacterota bacterium]
MSTLAIIQARLKSTRLPGKVLFKVNNEDTILSYQIKRYKLCSKIDKIIVATSTNSENDAIVDECRHLNIDCFRGSENDVLDRYYKCSLAYPDYQHIIRLTSDCPLNDPNVINNLIDLFFSQSVDFASTSAENYETFPDGIGGEIFTKELLALAASSASLPAEHEHVTPVMRKNKEIKKSFLNNPENFSRYRLTIDYPEDFEVIKFIINNSPIDAPISHYINLIDKNPHIFNINSHYTDNIGFKKYY